MADRPAEDAPQDIAPAFVGRKHAVGDEKSSGPQVIANDLERSVGLGGVRLKGDFSGSGVCAAIDAGRDGRCVAAWERARVACEIGGGEISVSLYGTGAGPAACFEVIAREMGVRVL